MKRKSILFLAAVFLCISIFFIVQTYAKYISGTSGTASIGIAKWNIIVNNLSIKENADISETIIPIFPGNSHIAENVIAPTAEGYFDIEFDFTNVDVSFVYKITISVNAHSVVEDLVATGYSIDSGSIVPFGSSDTSISEQIDYLDNIDFRTIRVYIMWDGTISSNAVHTAASQIPNGEALMDVNISFTQIASSTMTNGLINGTP